MAATTTALAGQETSADAPLEPPVRDVSTADATTDAADDGEARTPGDAGSVETAHRPVIATRLAMRRLAKNAPADAARVRRDDLAGGSLGAPSASLSVVQQARSGQRRPVVRSVVAAPVVRAGATPVRRRPAHDGVGVERCPVVAEPVEATAGGSTESPPG